MRRYKELQGSLQFKVKVKAISRTRKSPIKYNQQWFKNTQTITIKTYLKTLPLGRSRQIQPEITCTCS